MATNLFNAALEDSAILSEVASAVEQVAGNIDTVAEAEAVVSRAASDSAFKSSLESKLEAVAKANGLSPDLTSVITVTSAATSALYSLAAIAKMSANSTNPTSLSFAAAVEIFAPTLFAQS
jgi:hypothetical protein